MKQVAIIFLSRIAGGVLLFLLTIFLKEVVLDEVQFVSFSASYAYLIFLSSFSVIILNSIIVRKAFEINSAEDCTLILFYLFFFIFICYVSVEFSINLNLLKKESRLPSLYFLLTSLFGAVINGNFQIRQSFFKMAIWEFIKNTTTFLIILIFLKVKFHIDSNTVIVILAISNLYPLCSRCNVSMGDRYTIDEWNAIQPVLGLKPVTLSDRSVQTKRTWGQFFSCLHFTA